MANDCLNSFNDIIGNEILSDYRKFGNKKKGLYEILDQINNKTNEAASLPSDSFDDLVDSATSTSVFQSAKGAIDTATNIVDCVDSLDGSCLNGAVGGLSGLIKDTTGFIGDLFDEISNSLNIPTEILDLIKLIDKLRLSMGDANIGSLISSILEKLGCLGEENQTFQDIRSDINSVIYDFGLNPNGTYDDSTFDSILDDKIDSMGNIPSNVKDSVKTSTKNLQNITKETKETAKQNLESVKSNAKASSNTKINKKYI